MAERSAKKLDRLLRVRTLQLGMVRASEMQAHERVASETALKHRIAQLAADVAPRPESDFATSLIAAAHYRDRLHQTAAAAEQRVAAAESGLVEARERTIDARRDQSAVEKLIARANTDAALKALRAMEALPPTSSRNRHDPC
ncbi:hypothetical protein [Sphingomonas japonica]|uniref:Flagellar FliJ protein n=1 Tax=Sphingomonas japonica TaxID=511662 RepID=A0ABX0TZZ2_9SPHN|nr:hypothetical protein [Sphingomonas japonica]NIJ23829.1 hypothetical protein [Sphingomonas japonica]